MQEVRRRRADHGSIQKQPVFGPEHQQIAALFLDEVEDLFGGVALARDFFYFAILMLLRSDPGAKIGNGAFAFIFDYVHHGQASRETSCEADRKSEGVA